MNADNSIANALEEFKRTTKPDSDRSLHRFRDAIIDLYLTDYTLATIFKFVAQNGYGGSRATFYRWIKKHIDFEEERNLLRSQSNVSKAENRTYSDTAEINSRPGTDKPSEEKTTVDNEESAKNDAIPVPTFTAEPSDLEGSSARDPRAIMKSILGPSIEEQLKGI